MREKYVFEKQKDAEKVALEIVAFLKKWGMWEDVQIFTGGKCYSDDNGELVIRKESHPEKYTQGLSGPNCNGENEWKDFSNPERLLDMTFEGPLSLLLRHHEYEVRIADVSDEVKNIIVSEPQDYSDEMYELMDECLTGEVGWDPAEYDSYEEWLELNQYRDLDEFNVKRKDTDSKEPEFSSREEYEDFLLYSASERDHRILEYFDDDYGEITYSTTFEKETFFDDGAIASRVICEFNDLLEKYGLWYDLGFCWSLTTYRI